MHHLVKAMVLASVTLSLSIKITESLVPKQFLIEENRRGINGMLEKGSWKLIRSKGVSYTQCLVSIVTSITTSSMCQIPNRDLFR